jgi:aryl-alcohol dehydrogenase
MVAASQGDLVLERGAITGRSIVSVLEGGSSPQVLIPRLIDLWRAGRLPFDRMIERFPLSRINAAEQASLSGRTIKPVLIPDA